MSKLQSLLDITSVLPTPITGVSLSVTDGEYFNELRDEILSSDTVYDVGTLPINSYVTYPHLHFFSQGIEFLVKLDEK